MSLRSPLFRGDPKLESAAVSNSAHILPGAVGEHVSKIQRALNILDGANLSEDGVYNTATASAVLRYKQKRNIINRSYQTQADNIVGILTMTALDSEMLQHVDPTVIIGRLMFSVGPPAPNVVLPFAPAASAPSIGPTTNVRAVVRGNPYVPADASPQDGMPASLPPTKTYSVRVSIEPPLTGTSDFIELSIINSNGLNGTATVTPTRITQSTTVVVTGGSQTRPGNGGRLQIQAKLNGKEVKATSNGFSVCAHPTTYEETFFQDLNTPTAVGMIVKDTVKSDSGKFDDLDQVEISEVVEQFRKDEPPFNDGSGFVKQSDYMAAIPPPGKIAGDTHAEPRPSAGPKGTSTRIQLSMFKCWRCGAVDKAVPNSGYDIEHTVSQVGGKWKHRVIKKGTEIGITLRTTKATLKSKAGLGNNRSPEHDLP
jgi:hypothetical protein